MSLLKPSEIQVNTLQFHFPPSVTVNLLTHSTILLPYAYHIETKRLLLQHNPDINFPRATQGPIFFYLPIIPRSAEASPVTRSCVLYVYRSQQRMYKHAVPVRSRGGQNSYSCVLLLFVTAFKKEVGSHTPNSYQPARAKQRDGTFNLHKYLTAGHIAYICRIHPFIHPFFKSTCPL